MNDQADVDYGVSSTETGTLYCAGCNERFRVRAERRICPRCGAEATARGDADTLLSETLLCKFPSAIHGPDVSAPAETDRAARLVGRDLHVYQLTALLGRGGMGYVYLSQHKDLKRKCAVKLLSPRAAADDVDYTERFMAEGRAAAALVHPNVVTIHAIGEAEGLHFLEMEFVAGRSLQHLVQDEGRLTPIRATTLAARVAEGLAAAHRAGIVHRDLKPDNVLMTHHGVPKIGDFGLAKRIQVDDGIAGQYLIGTPNFMAPELFRGEGATPASDVYALGVTYFLMLTGRLPFTHSSLAALMRTVAVEPPPNVRDICPEVTLEMAEGLSLLMAKAPENRPRDGIEAAQLLHALTGQVRDIESLLREAFRHAPGVTWIRSGSRYSLQLTLPDGRRQRLFVEPSDHAAAERLILIYSVCCKAEPRYYEDALRLNAEVSHGALAIREIDGEEFFVMIDTYPRGTVDGEAVRRSVLEVAYRADAVEKLLTGLDEY